MNRQRNSSSSTFKTGCKHFVPGFFYKDIENRFGYIIDAPEPLKNKEEDHNANIVRLVVDIRDATGNHLTTSYIDIAHTPLRRVSQKFSQGFGKFLHNTSEFVLEHGKDCREGSNLGSMYVMGRRSYNGGLIKYATTEDELYQKLEDIGSTYFNTYGFSKWVNVLRRAMDTLHACGRNLPSGSKYPWTSMIVTTVNYGNEDHVDGGDDCQGITIWHESKRPTNKNNPNMSCTSWFFLFPNMEVLDSNGKWKKGVAVRLRHGTIITWDARLIRHCTSIPSFRTKNGKQVSQSFGTYFGIDRRVVNALDRTLTKAGKKKRKHHS